MSSTGDSRWWEGGPESNSASGPQKAWAGTGEKRNIQGVLSSLVLDYKHKEAVKPCPPPVYLHSPTDSVSVAVETAEMNKIKRLLNKPKKVNNYNSHLLFNEIIVLFFSIFFYGFILKKGF